MYGGVVLRHVTSTLPRSSTFSEESRREGGGQENVPPPKPARYFILTSEASKCFISFYTVCDSGCLSHFCHIDEHLFFVVVNCNA